MLEITVGEEGYNESTGEFQIVDGVTFQLEHSLVSVSKWEETYERPFLTSDSKTTEEWVEYVRMMTLTPNIPESVYQRLSTQNFEDIGAYLNATRTATWFSATAAGTSRETITSELVYYWMTALNIPVEFQYWHFNRLLTLIRVCNAKQEPPKKTNTNELAQQRAKLNAERKAKYNTTG